MRILASTVDRQTRIAGIVGSMLVASVLTSGAVSAADPTPAPEQGSVTIVSTDGSQPVLSAGSIAAQPVFVGDLSGVCGQPMIVGVAPDGTQTIEQGAPDASCSQGVITVSGPVTYGQGDVVFGGDPWGGPTLSGPVPYGPGSGGLSGVITVSAQAAGTVTVTSVAGTTVSLETDDGWTRDVDTSNVAITLDSDTLAASDLAAGDKVQVLQVQNADGTYTVTGLALILPQAMGTISAVTDTGFTVTEPDGTTTPVVVDDATHWPAAMPGATATGLASLTDGDVVQVRGKVAEDGTMTATEVVALGSVTFNIGDPGMPVPAPVAPTPGEPAPTPEASPAA